MLNMRLTLLINVVYIWILEYVTSQCGMDNGCSSSASCDIEFVTNKVYGCSGNWTDPGLENAQGLCSTGFEICESESAAAELGLTNELCESLPINFDFYATLQTVEFTIDANTSDAFNCTTYDVDSTGDVFGCANSNISNAILYDIDVNCGVLSAAILLYNDTDILIEGNYSWFIDPFLNYTDDATEQSAIQKLTNQNGGVLCCSTSEPTSQPSNQPTQQPSSQPSNIPTTQPSNMPSNMPTTIPTSMPSSMPSSYPTDMPNEEFNTTFEANLESTTTEPSTMPTEPSAIPTNMPSEVPSEVPSEMPTNMPSSEPSNMPTGMPNELLISTTEEPEDTNQPSSEPSSEPSNMPSSMPTDGANVVGTTYMPSDMPSNMPTVMPVTVPTGEPTIKPSIDTNVIEDVIVDCKLKFRSRLSLANFKADTALLDEIESACRTLTGQENVEITNVYEDSGRRRMMMNRMLLQETDIGVDMLITLDEDASDSDADSVANTVSSDTFVDDFNDELAASGFNDTVTLTESEADAYEPQSDGSKSKTFLETKLFGFEMLYVIIAGAALIILLCIIIGVCYYKNCRNVGYSEAQRQKSKKGKSRDNDEEEYMAGNENDKAFSGMSGGSSSTRGGRNTRGTSYYSDTRGRDNTDNLEFDTTGKKKKKKKKHQKTDSDFQDAVMAANKKEGNDTSPVDEETYKQQQWLAEAFDDDAIVEKWKKAERRASKKKEFVVEMESTTDTIRDKNKKDQTVEEQMQLQDLFDEL